MQGRSGPAVYNVDLLVDVSYREYDSGWMNGATCWSGQLVMVLV